jgi:hypothetical protein
MAESRKDNDVFFLYRAIGMSMFPYICDKEMLVVRKVSSEEINCGDVLLFSVRGASTKIAHFVGKKYIDNGKVFFQTKGSRGTALEEPVSFDQVAGKVMALKRGTVVFNLDSSGRRSISYRLSCFWCRCLYRVKNRIAGLLRIIQRNITQR